MAKQRLGKGLEALIPTYEPELGKDTAQPHLDIDLIDSNPFQPRQEFGDSEMADLIASIKSKGILQPLTVSESTGGRYQLIAGERRLRAAKSLNLEQVPVYLISVDTDIDLMEYALIENIQREDLNPMEQAEAFALLHSKYNLKQDEIARQVGMSRSAVANLLRLLRLPTEIKESIKSGALTMGHARALLGLKQEALMLKLGRKIVSDGLSVRQIEAQVQEIGATTKPLKTRRKKKTSAVADADPYLNQVEVDLLTRLSTKVRVKPKSDAAGIIEVAYYSHEDLERIRDIIVNGDK